MPSREALAYHGVARSAGSASEAKRLRVASEESPARGCIEGIADRGVELCEGAHPGRVRHASEEADALEVDEARFESGACRSQEDVARLQVAVVDSGAVEAEDEAEERIEGRVADGGSRRLEYAVGSLVGPQVLEQDDRSGRKPETAPLDEGEGGRCADGEDLEPMSRGEGAAARRPPETVGEGAGEPAWPGLLRHHPVSFDLDRADGAVGVAVDHLRASRRGSRLVGGDRRCDGRFRERTEPQPMAAGNGDGRCGTALSEGMAPPARRMAPRPLRRCVAHRPDRRARRRIEGADEPEGGCTNANPVARGKERREGMVEMAEVADPRGVGSASSRPLEVEQHGAPGADEDVSHVEVDVDESAAVERRDGAAERRRQRAAVGGAGVECSRKRRARDVLHQQQTIAIGEDSQRERLGNGGPRSKERPECAPLTVRRAPTEPGPRALAPGMAARARAEVLEQEAACVLAEAHHPPVGALVERLAFCALEPGDGGVPGRGASSEPVDASGHRRWRA